MRDPIRENVPVFIPSSFTRIYGDNVQEDDFHLLFCKLYVFDCFQNKKCLFRGLTKVWIPCDTINKEEVSQVYPFPKYSPPREDDQSDEDASKDRPVFQQIDSIYGGQLKKRFSSNFDPSTDTANNNDTQTGNNEFTNPSNVAFSFVNDSREIIDSRYTGIQIDNEPITVCSEDSYLPVLNHENNDEFNNYQFNTQNNIESLNSTKTTEEIETFQHLDSLKSIGNKKLGSTDYELLLPHSVVESTSYLDLPPVHNSQDQNFESLCGVGLFNEDAQDMIPDISDNNDRKDCFSDYFNHRLDCLENDDDIDDDTFSLTDISNSTVTGKKGKRLVSGKSMNIECEICGRKCRSINALNHHMLVHSEDRPYVCEICKKAFKEHPTLRRHMWTHMEKQHQCDICEKYFVEKSSLRRHITTIHADFKPGMTTTVAVFHQQLCCGKCGKTFKSNAKYNMHKVMHGNPDYECEICGKVYAGPSHLRIHQRIHTGEKPYCCTICNMNFAFKHVLKSHQARIHHKVHKFKCNVCSLSFVKKADLATHASSHMFNIKNNTKHYVPHKPVRKHNMSDKQNHIQKSEKSDIDSTLLPVNSLFSQLIDVNCDKADQLEISLPLSDLYTPDKEESCKSPKSISDQAKKNKECMECLKTFDRMGDLKRHIISHIVENITKKAREQNHSVPLYECELCYNVVFKQVDKFKKHLREHAKLTLYQCDVCDRAFGDSSNFSKHKKVHGIAYLKCTICNRKFNTRRMMGQHMEYHRHNKPKSCNYCKKVFHFESNLRKHIKIAHLSKGKMTYRCEECGERFGSVKLKWEHQWEQHRMRKVNADCNICHAQFRKVSLLRAHLIKEHATMSCPINCNNKV